jgi:hypothetical protein
MHRAALNMYMNDDGDTFKTDKLEQRSILAWQALRAAEMKAIAVNALDSPSARTMQIGMGTRYNPMYPGGRLR